MLPSFYHNILEKYLNPKQLLTLNMLACVVTISQTSQNRTISRNSAINHFTCTVAAVTYNGFYLLKRSAYLWGRLGSLREVISRQIKAGTHLIIALDRTQWKKYNVLMVSAIYQKRTFPIFGTLLDKQGASNLAEQQQVLRRLIPI